jgi:hypothetical protein
MASWNLPSLDNCPHNFDDEFINKDGHFVCTLCGLCGGTYFDYTDSSSYMASGRQHTILYGVGSNGGNGKRKRNPHLPIGRFPGSTYKSKYHTNERMAQVLMTGPRVPHCILFCIKAHYYLSPAGVYPPLAELQKRDIGRICKDTPVPQDIRVRYRSSKPPYRLVKDFTQYSERWYFILSAFGLSVTMPREDEADRLKRFCQMAQDRWSTVRHVLSCQNPNIDCHKKYGCRKNFPSLYYVMGQLCRMLDYHHLLPCFPVNSQPKNIKDLDGYWKHLCEHLDWPFEPWARDNERGTGRVHRRRFY